jgi:phosphatidylserine/phosphatidylglycerophosphate/cardiolipin synthase-like enzyme
MPVENAPGSNLRAVSTDDLLQLISALKRGTLRAPLTGAALELSGFGYLRTALLSFQNLDAPALTLLFEAVLAERGYAQRKQLDVVWSGTDAGPSHARYTQIVVPELIARAQRSITIAGYSFDQGSGIFAGLRDAMVERGVRVRFFLDVQQLQERLVQQLVREKRFPRLLPLKLARLAGSTLYAQAVLALFLELHWPYGGVRPDLYFDPRTAEPRSHASLHAKCVIVDHEHSLITSANFTNRGQTRNIELGVLIHDRAYASAVEQQWNALVESGGVVLG